MYTLRLSEREVAKGRWAGKRRAHEHDRREEIRADERAMRRDARAEIVPNNGGDRRVPQRIDECDDVFDHVEDAERREIVLVRDFTTGFAAFSGLAEASLVGCDDGETAVC